MAILTLFWALNLLTSPTLAAVIPGKVTNGTLTLGYLISWSHEWAIGPLIGSALNVGLKEVRRRQLIPDYEIEWILADTWCEVSKDAILFQLHFQIVSLLELVFFKCIF